MAIDLGSLGDLFITVGADVSGLDNDLAKAIASADQAGQKMADAFSGGFKKVGDQLDLFTPLAEQVGQQMNFAFTDAANGVNTFSAAVNEAAGVGGGGGGLGHLLWVLQDFDGEMMSLGGSLAIVGAGLIAFSATMGEVVKSSLDTAGAFERTEIAFKTLTGSADIAKAEMQGLVETFKDSGVQLDTVLHGMQNLLSRGFSVDAANRTIGVLVDASAALNISLDRLVTGFDNLQTRGTAALTLMARQGIPVFQMLAEAANTSKEEIEKAVKSGMLDADTIMEALLTQMQSNFGGLAKSIGQTWTGLMTDIQNHLELTMKVLGDGFLPMGEAAAKALLPLIDELQAAAQWFGELPGPVKEAVLALGGLAGALGATALAVGGILYVLPTLVAGVQSAISIYENWGAVSATLSGTFPLLSGAISSLGFAVVAAAAAFAGWELGEWLANNVPAIHRMGEEIGALILQIPLLGTGFQHLVDYANKTGPVMDSTSEAIGHLQKTLTDAGVAFNKLVPSTEGAAEAYDDYLNTLLKGAAAQQKLAADAVNYKGTLDLVGSGLTAVAKKQQELDNAVVSAQQIYDRAVQSYGAGSENAIRAQVQLQAAISAAHPALKQQGEDFDELGQSETRFFEETKNLLDKVPADFADFSAGLAKGFNFDALDRQMLELINKLKDSGYASEGFVKTLIDSLDAAQARLASFTAAKDWDDAILKLQAIGDKINDVAKFTQEGTQLMGLAFNNAKMPIDDFSKALNTLGIAADGETKKLSADLTAFNTVLSSNAATLGTVEGAWTRIMEAARKVANDPESWGKLMQAADAYLSKLQEMGAPLQAQLAAQQQILQLELAQAQANSQDAISTLAISEALSNVQIHTRALHDETMGLSDLYTGMIGTFGKLWDNFDKGIADAIVSGKNFGQVMQDVLKQFETQITELVTHYLLGQLKDAFLQNTNALTDFGKAFNAVFGVGGGSGGATAQTWQDLPLNMPQLGSVAGGASQAAGQVSQLTSGILGTLSQTINMISGIGQLITGIIQSFQNARMETTLNAIEENTRRSTQANELTFNEAHAGWINLNLFRTDFDGWFHDAFASLMSTVENMRDLIAAGGLGSSSTKTTVTSGGGDGATLPDPSTLASQTSALSNASSNVSNAFSDVSSAATGLNGTISDLNSGAQSLTHSVFNANGTIESVYNAAGALIATINHAIVAMNGPLALNQAYTGYGSADETLSYLRFIRDGSVTPGQSIPSDFVPFTGTPGTGALTPLATNQTITGYGTQADLLAQLHYLQTGILTPPGQSIPPDYVPFTGTPSFSVPNGTFGNGGGAGFFNGQQHSVVININGAIYGQQGAQMVGQELTNALRTIAGQRLF